MLTTTEISTLIDNCLESERAALSTGDWAEAAWYERIWFVLIFEMNDRD